MADREPHSDEYHFTDTDSQVPEPIDTESPRAAPSGNPVLRNALIVVVLILLLYIIYRFIWPLFTGPKAPVQPAIPPVAQTTPQPEPPRPIPTPTPAPPPPVQPVNQSDNQLKSQVSTLEVGQQGLRSDVTTLNTQMNSLNSKVDELTNQISRLNQALTTLSNQVTLQSQEMQVLIVKAKPKMAKPKVKKIAMAPVTYNIQAVIPGRAWLIGTNGSILTVREGIKIKGYGVVQLIDAMQGRVVTSSGKIIRFSPEDS